MKILIVLWISSLTPYVWAAKLSFKPLNYSNKEVRSLSIVGYGGNVRVLGKKGDDNLKIEVEKESPEAMDGDIRQLQEQWAFGYTLDNGHLKLEIKEPSDKEGLLKVFAQKKSPNFNIVISGAPVNLEVFWHNGSVKISNWTKSIMHVQQKGRVEWMNLTGEKNSLYLRSGNMSLSQIKGRVKIESYNASQNLSEIEGVLDMDNFMGPLVVQSSQASLNLRQQKGYAEFKNIEGDIQYELGEASLKVLNLKGNLNGKAESGSLVAEIQESPNIRVRSVDGPITLGVKKSSARVNIGSVKGQLIAPSYLKKQQWSTIKTLSGRLRGNGSGGSVYVRTESANIRIR